MKVEKIPLPPMSPEEIYELRIREREAFQDDPRDRAAEEADYYKRMGEV